VCTSIPINGCCRYEQKRIRQPEKNEKVIFEHYVNYAQLGHKTLESTETNTSKRPGAPSVLAQNGFIVFEVAASFQRVAFVRFVRATITSSRFAESPVWVTLPMTLPPSRT